jgi:hypothetical protein
MFEGPAEKQNGGIKMIRTFDVILASAFGALGLLVTACGGSSVNPQSGNSEKIQQSTFDGNWPVTATSGTLACDSAKGNAVTFTPDTGGTVYAVNGPAVSWGKNLGWPDAKEIWNGNNWGSFIEQGLDLCKS